MEFEVSVLPSGRKFGVAEGETVLEAAMRQSVGLPYSCRDGSCGTCKTRLVSGEVALVEHSETALTSVEREEGWTLPCRAHAESDIVLEAPNVVAEDMFPIKKMACRVGSIVRPSSDVAVLHLQLPGSETYPYHPGQYLDLSLKDGTRRSYSMGAVDASKGVELHIRRMPGGLLSGHVYDQMKAKDVLRLEGPFGSFFLREEAGKPIILLASGTGFAPIKAIIENIQRKGITTPATLYWGCRSKADLYMHEWALKAAQEIANLTYVPVLSDPLPSDEWTGRLGLVHRAVMEDFPSLSAHQVYACGAPIMVESARTEFSANCGLHPDEFFADSFVTNHSTSAAPTAVAA